MHLFEHINAPDLATASRFLREAGTEAIAGGTDLLGELKRRIRGPKLLVNLKTIPGLKELRHGTDLRLGCLVTLSEIEHHPLVVEKFSALTQAASLSAVQQLRHMGTLGGNLCQHVRCWYYRNPLFHCWLKGGEKCFAVDGENKYHAILGGKICHAVHPSDLAPALIALDATVQWVGPGKKREIDLGEFYAIPEPNRRGMTILQPGGVITGVRVPMPSLKSRSLYLKVMERQAWAFALVSVAANVTFKDNRMKDVRLVLGGVAPVPWRLREAERILEEERFSDNLARRAAEAALADAKPLRENGYKVKLAKELIQRALAAIVM